MKGGEKMELDLSNLERETEKVIERSNQSINLKEQQEIKDIMDSLHTELDEEIKTVLMQFY